MALAQRLSAIKKFIPSTFAPSLKPAAVAGASALSLSTAERFALWYNGLAGYQRYGLLADDLLPESPEVVKALESLPKEVILERNIRLKRAMDMGLKRAILPAHEWTRPEHDVPYLTLAIERQAKIDDDAAQFE